MSDDVDYGPLTGLIGVWEGDKGTDVAPEPDGPAVSGYFETIVFEAAGEVENAESQRLAVVRYHQVVRRKTTGEVFHNESGYWMWDSATATVMQVLAIPRGVSLIAGGAHQSSTSETIRLDVNAALDDPDWGILQAPFMRDNARTTAFRHHITLAGDSLTYGETTVVEIYGSRFEHTDQNTLTRA